MSVITVSYISWIYFTYPSVKEPKGSVCNGETEHKISVKVLSHSGHVSLLVWSAAGVGEVP